MSPQPIICTVVRIVGMDRMSHMHIAIQNVHVYKVAVESTYAFKLA